MARQYHINTMLPGNPSPPKDIYIKLNIVIAIDQKQVQKIHKCYRIVLTLGNNIYI